MTDDVGLLKYFYYGIAGLHKIYRRYRISTSLQLQMRKINEGGGRKKQKRVFKKLYIKYILLVVSIDAHIYFTRDANNPL